MQDRLLLSATLLASTGCIDDRGSGEARGGELAASVTQADTMLGGWNVVYHPVQYNDSGLPGGSAADYGNLYSPSALFVDGPPAYYISYFGGWGDSASQTNDKLYYSTSADGASWSPRQVTLTSEEFNNATRNITGCSASCNIASNPCSRAECTGCAFLMNAADVVRVWNSVSQSWLWTMAHEPAFCGTDTAHPVTNFYGAIWTSVSSDGVHWGTHQRATGSAASNSHEPSLIADPGTANGVSYFYKLYYYKTSADPNACKALQMTLLDGTRHAVSSEQTVFTSPDSAGCVSNPTVRRIGLNGEPNPWQLFYQCNSATRWNICRVKAASNSSFASAGLQYLVQVDPNQSTIYGVGQPGVLSWPNSNYYDLFFAVTNINININPDLASQRWSEINRWRMQNQ